MQTIQEQKDGDIYYCDIDISKEEWLGILKDESVADNYKDTIVCFYRMPGHKGTCASVGKKFGKKPASLNINVWQFGKYVQNRLNRFECINTAGDKNYWPVPMGQGRVLKGGGDGSFEWQLRPELAEAVKDYLYWNLLEKYKKHRQTIAFDTADAYEVYKWQLITVCQGKTPIEIVKAHNANPTKPEKGGFYNLIDVIHDNVVLKYLAENKTLEFESALNELVIEQNPLNERLYEFKTTLEKILQDVNYNSKANDERTAAVILTCCNPQRYAFYKNEFYKKLCEYLGVETKKAGEKYSHYLQLIEPLVHLIENDHELEEIIKNSCISNLLQSNMLLAQDVCWELFVAFPGGKNYWLLSWNPDNWNWEDYTDWAKGTKSGSTYKMSWTCSSKQPNIGDHIFLMKTGSEPRGIVAHGKVVRQSYEAPHYDSEKAAAGKTAPHIDVEFDGIRNYTTESILQIDTLTQTFPEQTWIPQSSGIQIKCDVDELQKMWNELQGNQIITDMDKYIELLKANHNLILTGAPGTGKTYLAKQIAEAMGCTENEIGFVQFHPSYDYTDFVEGLRPLNDDSGNVGFERKDGVFKTFCAKALENLLDSQKSLQTLQQETSVRDLIEDFVQDAIESDIKLETQGTRNVFHIIENKAKHITIDIPKNEKTRVISLPKSDLITLLENKVEISGSKDIQLYFQRKYRTQQDSYTYVLYEKLKSLKSNAKVETISLIPKKNYVFIIDEINRGEISKIFGELFFSIDPGYRGESGRVDTQYQNMVEDGDVFKKGFFVPENVYIIGTMNDIDRSVESMDFAMRRRFAWKEVSADDSMQMLDGMANANEMKARMTSLNKAILAIKELGKAYQIGAAYFKKYELYNDFNKLWEYHLEGVLREYLRGNPNAEEQLKELKKAYDIESATDESDDTNE